MNANWFDLMMNDAGILPPDVSWREYAEHCLTHDPLPVHEEKKSDETGVPENASRAA